MQIREIDPNDTMVQSVQESIASKFKMPKISMPVPRQPVPQPKPTVEQVRTKPRVIVRSDPVEQKVAFMQPSELITPAPTPSMHRTAPLPIYRPQATDFQDTAEIYNSRAAYDPIAIATPKTIKAPRQHFKLNFSMKKLPLLVAEGVVGFVAIYLGLTQTGSYYTPASRFAGDLATVFYGYQLGTLAAMVGVVLIYDAIRRAGNL